MIKNTVFLFSSLLLIVLQVSLADASLNADPFETNKIGQMRYYPGVAGIPVEDFQNILLPGYLERAQANMELIEIIYSSKKFKEKERLFELFPHWRFIIDNHSGVWSELIGRLEGKSFDRMFGPDIWRSVEGSYVVGEENGPNIGGIESLRSLSETLKRHKEVGEIPYDEDIFQRIVGHIKEIGVKQTGKKASELTIVVADEVSLASEAIRVGDELISPPCSMAKQTIDILRNAHREAGVTWLSLVDREDKKRIFVKDKILYLKDEDGSFKKVDVFFSMADLESMDPTYGPQLARNLKAHRKDLNKTAKLVGISGLLEAWLGKNSFVWANNPTSTLSANKVWPVIVDEYIKYRFGHDPILPVQKTITFFNENGKFDLEKFRQIINNPDNYFIKQTLGQGGKQVWPLEDFDQKELLKFAQDLEIQLKHNPYSYIAQPKVRLDQIDIDWQGKVPSRKFFYDLRIMGMISSGDTQVISRQVMVRLSQKKKINISQNGMQGMAVPAHVKKLEIIPPVPKAGTAYIPYEKALKNEIYQKILDDGNERALVEAMLIHDIYSDPADLFKTFPALKHIITKNPHYNSNYYMGRSSRYPTMFLSGPDYIKDEFGKLSAIEHNTSYPGGYLRLWRRKEQGIIDGLQHWFEHVLNIDKDENKFTVYYMEESDLGDDWEKIRKQFKDDFGIVLASKSEKNRFKVKGNKLFFKDDDGFIKKVSSMILYIEPDFLDHTVISDNQLGSLVSAKKRSHEIPGLLKVIRYGNLVVVNEPGVDISCAKVLLPFMSELRQYYLGKNEIIPTQKSWSFIDDSGKLVKQILKKAIDDPHKFIIKYGADLGGGDSVKNLSILSESQRQEVYLKVKKDPHLYILQKLSKHQVEDLGFHTEFRPFSMAQVNWDRSQIKGQVISTLPVIYGRGANGNDMANISPTAGQKAGFNIPVIRKSKIVGSSNCVSSIDKFL